MLDADTPRSLAAEHKIVTALMNKVKSVLAVVPEVHRDQWLDSLRQNFGRLRAHMKQHMQGEEADGFMGPVLEQRPTLSPEVTHLKDEHVEIGKLLDGIWDELVAVKSEDRLLIKDSSHRIQHLLSAIEHHEEHEELLVTYVFSQDIGGRS